MIRSPLRIAAITSCLTFALTSLSGASETMTVRLQSGRTFTAAVDARTDDNRLWLRFGAGSTVVLRPVAWSAIVDAWREGEPVDRRRLREVAEAMKSPVDPSPSENLELVPTAAPEALWRPVPRAVEITPRVTSLAFAAHLSNFDADAEPDGLVVVVRPFDAWGRILPIDGVVEVELHGAVRRTFQSAPQSGGVVHDLLGRWTKPLHAAVATPDGYLVKLPFPHRRLEPAAVASRGRVHVRLVVPGHGVFEDVRDGVAIQPYAPLRDAEAVFARDRSGR